MSEPALAEPVYYRISTDLRRCAVYVIVGCLLLAPVSICVACFVNKADVLHAVLASSIFLVPTLAMVVVLRWSLRIDHQGVSRRLMFGWHLWQWSELASGRIQKQHSHTLVDPKRPWWRRKLRLGYMSPGDIRQVIDRINTHYQLPPAPKLPETLTIKYGFRSSATLDRNGMHVLASGQPHEYLWDEVRRVHIIRMDPLRRDFKRLAIVLPDREVELRMVTHQGGTSPTWSGASAEEINEFLRQYVPKERMDLDIHGEQNAKRVDREKQLAEELKRWREFRIAMCIFLPLMAGTLIWMAIENVGQAIFMGVMTLILLGPVLWFVWKTHRKRCAEQAATVDGSDANEQEGDANN